MSNRNVKYIEKQSRILKAVISNISALDGMFQELETHENAVEKLVAAMVAVEYLAIDVDLVENEYKNAFLDGDDFLEYRHKSK